MRLAGVDLGLRRIGLAASDPSGTLARPWKTIAAGATPERSAGLVRSALTHYAAETGAAAAGEPAGLAAFDAIVVGWPERLGGGDTHLTEAVRRFVVALQDLTGLRVERQDERLSSHEADARLGARERDWRKRKAQLDAAAAAVILQDYLDARLDRDRSDAASQAPGDTRGALADGAASKAPGE
jgi:putative Holliday junction resolvase